jgi:hypothetical protein
LSFLFFSSFLSARALFSWYFFPIRPYLFPPQGGGYFPIYRPLAVIVFVSQTLNPDLYGYGSGPVIDWDKMTPDSKHRTWGRIDRNISGKTDPHPQENDNVPCRYALHNTTFIDTHSQSFITVFFQIYSSSVISTIWSNWSSANSCFCRLFLLVMSTSYSTQNFHVLHFNFG